jgi:hypothetical protein
LVVEPWDHSLDHITTLPRHDHTHLLGIFDKMSSIANTAISTTSSLIETLIKMSGIRQRSLRDWKLPFTGHHLIYPDPVEQAIIYTFAPFLLCCTAHHIIKGITNRIKKGVSRNTSSRSNGYDRLDTDSDVNSEGVEQGGRRKQRWTRWYRAPMTGVRNTMELRTLPASWVSVSNYAELCWTLLYCAIVLVPTFYLSYGEYCKMSIPRPKQGKEADISDGSPGMRHRWANPTGAAVSFLSLTDVTELY